MLSVIFATLVQLGLRHLLSRRFSLLAVQLFRSSSALLTLSLVDIRRTFLRSKAHACSTGHSALHGTTFSLPAGAGLSSLRLVIVSRTKVKVKDGRGSLYITHATGAIIPRLSANEQTRRAAVRAAFMLTLLCRSVTAFTTAVAQRSGYPSSFSRRLQTSTSSLSSVVRQLASAEVRQSGESV
jgi:hypothetical protein